MANIRDIPFDVIIFFLEENNYKVPIDEDDKYNTAKDIILTSKADFYPDTIINWIIAYNLLDNIKYIKKYNRNQIQQLPSVERRALLKLLELEQFDEDVIMDVLFYLGKAGRDKVPNILKEKFDIWLQKYQNGLISISALRDNIFKENNLEDDYDFEIFVGKLLKMKEFGLVKEILAAQKNNNLYSELGYAALTADFNKEILKTYLEMAPKNFDWNDVVLDNAKIYYQDRDGFVGEMNFFKFIMEIAIETKMTKLLSIVVQEWEYYRNVIEEENPEIFLDNDMMKLINEIDRLVDKI